MVDPFDVPDDVLRARTSEKWRHFGPDVIPAWVAEMDVALAPSVVAAVERAVRTGDTGYPSGSVYLESLSAFAKQRWGWNFDPAHAVMVPNVMVGVMAALELVLDPGMPVVTSLPVYPPLQIFPRRSGYELVTVRLDAHFRIDFAALAECFCKLAQAGRVSRAGFSGAYVLCNPHNPTGVVPSAAELAQLGQLARKYRVAVVSDEIHAPVSFVPVTPALTAIPDAIAVLSASKAWNLAGLNIAAVVLGSQCPVSVRDFAPHWSSAVSHVAMQAHVAALTDGIEWLDALLAGLAHRRELLGGLLARRLPQIGYVEPAATYLAWLDFAALANQDQAWALDPAGKLIDESRVALSAGAPFGSRSCARLNFATSAPRLVELIDRIALAVERTA